MKRWIVAAVLLSFAAITLAIDLQGQRGTTSAATTASAEEFADALVQCGRRSGAT